MKKLALVFLFLVLLCNSAVLLAQAEPEGSKTETEKFQDYFFEALLQKGIENYDKALIALNECQKLRPDDATILFEKGKNYLLLKQYEQAYTDFESATKIDPNNKWFWVGMYDVCYQTKDFNKGILVITKLIELDQVYKEDLVALYMNTQQFDKALTLINEMNAQVGKSERRESYKRQILSQGKYQNAEIENLVEQIKKDPKEESNYIELLKLYTNSNETQKAIELTQKLASEIPNSEWAQVGLFKYYLDAKEAKKAIESMNIVLASSKMDAKIKHRILNEFLIFVNTNPQFAPDLEKAISYFDKEKEVDVAKEIGKYYHNKKQYQNAIQYYEQALKNSTNQDVETQMLLLQSLVETKQFEKVAKKASELVEIFPAQPQFYYFAGMANNQMKKYKIAKDMLEMGMDFVINDIPLEINFNLQLGEAYNGLGDFKKKEHYFSKATQLLKDKK